MPTGYAQPTTPRLLAGGVASSAVAVPTQVVVDHQSIALVAAEGQPDPGQAAVTLPAPQSGYGYLVEVIDIWSNSSNASTAGVYLGSAAPQNELDYSSSAGHDVANEARPLYVPSGQPLLIVWSGLSAGAQVTARVQYAVVRFVTVTYQ